MRPKNRAPEQRVLQAASCTLVLAVAARLAAQDNAPLQPERAIALPGVTGRFDHMTLDASGKRLWLAALGNHSVEVLDLEAGQRLRSIDGPKEPQGVVLLPESNRVVVASGEDGMLRVFDESMKVIASLEGLADADNVRYDPQEQRIYVGYAQGALAVIDPEKVAKLADIKLEGHPESFQLEPRGRRIFVNVPSAKQVAVIDRDKAAVVAKWPVTEAYANYPMALDEAHERLLIVCRKPPRLLVLDTKSGRVVAQLECCGDADDIFYDADRRRIYISGGEGCISVFEQQDADRYSPLAKIATVTGARTSLLSPQTGRLYLAVPHGSGREAEVRVYRIQP